jgi:hypothetical protein
VSPSTADYLLRTSRRERPRIPIPRSDDPNLSVCDFEYTQSPKLWINPLDYILGRVRILSRCGQEPQVEEVARVPGPWRSDVPAPSCEANDDQTVAASKLRRIRPSARRNRPSTAVRKARYEIRPGAAPPTRRTSRTTREMALPIVHGIISGACID